MKFGIDAAIWVSVMFFLTFAVKAFWFWSLMWPAWGDSPDQSDHVE